jgi:hypothetical protein
MATGASHLGEVENQLRWNLDDYERAKEVKRRKSGTNVERS